MYRSTQTGSVHSMGIPWGICCLSWQMLIIIASYVPDIDWWTFSFEMSKSIPTLRSEWVCYYYGQHCECHNLVHVYPLLQKCCMILQAQTGHNESHLVVARWGMATRITWESPWDSPREFPNREEPWCKDDHWTATGCQVIAFYHS